MKKSTPPSDLSRINHSDIAVIGGGASGMAAAWYALKRLKHESGKRVVTLFERNDRLGKKLLMTGNGRCNLTNTDTSIDRFHGSDTAFARPALSLFPPEKVIAVFGEMGVVCTVEEDRKVYPSSLHAGSILDALRLAIEEDGVCHCRETMIAGLSKDGDQFVLDASGGGRFTASSVIVATGGKCAPATGSDGGGYRLLGAFSHELVTPLPSIVQLKTDIGFVKPLSGNKISGAASLFVDGAFIRKEPGEILFTDYGLSGPPILQLSGYVSRTLAESKSVGRSPGISIELDLLPGFTPDEIVEMLRHRRRVFGARKLEEYLTGLFHRRLAYGLLKASVGLPLSALVGSLTDAQIDALTGACKALPVAVRGTMPFANAQVTAGGIATSGFNPATMESKRCAGLYACGEVLDIDGDCGGFNLQWAWASGFLAGSSAAGRFCAG